MLDDKHIKKKRNRTVALMLVTASATFVIAWLIFRTNYGMDSNLSEEIRVYAQARQYISELFVGDLDESELTDAAISAVIEALDDEWSYYMTAEEYEAFVRQSNNEYQGIGISFTRTEDTNAIEITSVTAGSPAAEAGLAVGDVITAINGESVSDLESEDIREIILDNLGNTVTLTIEGSDGKTRETQVKSEEYYVNPVSYEMLENNVGYIKIVSFDSDSGKEGIAAIDELISDGATALVFDVRNNPGGRVSELLELLDYILPQGEMFISADRDGNETIEISDENSIEMPMAVLVNANSYSAAEYFAAILQEYEWADIVGERTTGKGRSQLTLTLSDGSAIHISTKRYFTPAGVDLSDVGGIIPDHEVELISEEDEQLQKAIQTVQE